MATRGFPTGECDRVDRMRGPLAVMKWKLTNDRSSGVSTLRAGHQAISKWSTTRIRAFVKYKSHSPTLHLWVVLAPVSRMPNQSCNTAL